MPQLHPDVPVQYTGSGSNEADVPFLSGTVSGAESGPFRPCTDHRILSLWVSRLHSQFRSPWSGVWAVPIKD
jgi:hypothetical protein